MIGGEISSGSETRDDVHNANVTRRPRILLMGLRRSGKTSIQQVIFTKMQPSQTQFLESTARLTTKQYSCGSFIHFQVQELPGQMNAFPLANHSSMGNGQLISQHDETNYLAAGDYDIDRLLKNAHAVVYIIDAQDDYSEAVGRLNLIIQSGRRVNQKLRYEVFIHKVDQLSDDAKFETQRDIDNQVRDRCSDSIGVADGWPKVSGPNAQDIPLSFHLTSIYDHSIFEAFSKVIQKLLPQYGKLESSLTYLIGASNMDHALLFDVQTKISIATDSSHADMQMYELCCDMIDLLLNMSEIYGQPNDHSTQSANSDEDVENQLCEEEISPDYVNDEQENILDQRSIKTTDETDETTDLPEGSDPNTFTMETADEPAFGVFDSMSSSVIKLTGGRGLYLKEVNRHLALICILREDSLNKLAIIEYNVRKWKESILPIIHMDQKN